MPRRSEQRAKEESMVSRLPRGVVRLALVCAVVVVAGSASALAAPPRPSADPFYVPPATLAGAKPGDVLRTRRVPFVYKGVTLPNQITQVLYRTTGEHGQPTATVTSVIEPTIPAQGSRLISYQLAYDTLEDSCDPSYLVHGGRPDFQSGQLELVAVQAYLAAGYPVVLSDYEGTAYDWFAGRESAYNTLDGIRAAERALGLSPRRTPVGMVGYSGGSFATEFAAEEAPRYAPELDLVGSAIGGIPVDFEHMFRYINGSTQWGSVIPAVMTSLNRAYGNDFSRYLSPYGKEVTNTVEGQCIVDFVNEFPGITWQKMLRPQYHDLFAIPSWAKIVNANLLGSAGTPKTPFFIGVGNKDGTGDGVIVTADDEALAYAHCRSGLPVQFTEYSGDDHQQAATPFEVAAGAWLTERLRGLPAPNRCASVGKGNALDPVPVRPASMPSPAAAKLRLHYLGISHKAHGAVVELSTRSGTLRRLVVTLHRAAKTVARTHITKLSTTPQRVVLRVHSRIPAAGRYFLTVRRGPDTVLHKVIRVR
jgi:pimeloyl-ACP methyl ester carboxylesterase